LKKAEAERKGGALAGKWGCQVAPMYCWLLSWLEGLLQDRQWRRHWTSWPWKEASMDTIIAFSTADARTNLAFLYGSEGACGEGAPVPTHDKMWNSRRRIR